MNKDQQKEMSFLEHLESLRWHIIRALLAIIILAVVAFLNKNIVFDIIILAPKNPDFFTNDLFCLIGEKLGISTLCINSTPLELQNINMAGQFSTHITVSIVAGLIVGFPYIFYEFWRFLSPALYENEKKHSQGAIFFSTLLFVLGVLFGYYLITPLSVHFLGSYNVSGEVINSINLRSYISTVTSVTLASGVVFELPMVIYFLSKVGLVTPEFLIKYRRHAIVLILILSAIITPPDLFSQILVCLPLLILYQIGIAISRRVIKRQLRKQKS